jgi:hypothetical protein
MPRVKEKERSQYSAYVDLGWSVNRIAKKFNRSWNTVNEWVEREDVKDRKGRGRKRKTTSIEDKIIVERYKKKWRKKSLGRRAITQDLQAEPNGLLNISGDTAYRRIKEAGGKMKIIKKRFPLTDRHKENRVRFAKEMKDEDFDQWLWSDETQFEIGTRKRKAFHFPGENLEQTRFKHPISQLVWVCLSANGPGELTFIDGTLTGTKYQNLLVKHLFKASRKLFGKDKWKVRYFVEFASHF